MSSRRKASATSHDRQKRDETRQEAEDRSLAVSSRPPTAPRDSQDRGDMSKVTRNRDNQHTANGQEAESPISSRTRSQRVQQAKTQNAPPDQLQNPAALGPSGEADIESSRGSQVFFEVVGNICEYCDTETLLSLRHVRKDAHLAATRFLFKQIQISRSLEDVKRISDSQLAEHVTTVNYYPDLLPYHAEKSWAGKKIVRVAPKCDERPSNERMQATDSSKSDEVAPTRRYEDVDEWRRFGDLLQEQRRWRKDVHAVVLKEYLLRLPNLTEATVWSIPDSRTRYKQTIWKYVRHQNETRSKHMHFWRDGPIHAETDGASAILFLEAIGYRHRNKSPDAKPIEKLVIQMLRNRDTLHGALDNGTFKDSATRRSERLDDILRAFEPLTSFEFADHQWTDTMGAHGGAEELQKFLLRATNLEHLHLRWGHRSARYLSYTWDPFTSDTGLIPFFSRPVVSFAKLQVLEVSTMITAGAFTNFLNLHSGTLKSLAIRDSVCDDSELLLRGIAKLRLGRFYIKALHFWEHGGVNRKGRMRRRQFRCTYFREGSEVASPFNAAMKAWFAQNGDGELPQEYREIAHRENDYSTSESEQEDEGAEDEGRGRYQI